MIASSGSYIESMTSLMDYIYTSAHSIHDGQESHIHVNLQRLHVTSTNKGQQQQQQQQQQPYSVF